MTKGIVTGIGIVVGVFFALAVIAAAAHPLYGCVTDGGDRLDSGSVTLIEGHYWYCDNGEIRQVS